LSDIHLWMKRCRGAQPIYSVPAQIASALEQLMNADYTLLYAVPAGHTNAVIVGMAVNLDWFRGDLLARAAHQLGITEAVRIAPRGNGGTALRRRSTRTR
jgi:hypothetical protein